MDDSRPLGERECFKLPDEDKKSTRELALARCNCLMERYLRWKGDNHKKSNRAQYAALILTAVTPVLLLIPSNYVPSDYVRLAAAAASAVAAIATGLLAINGWRDNYLRYGSTWHALQTEKYLYLTHAAPDYSGDEEKAARTFAYRIEQLVKDEVTRWQGLMERSDQPNGADNESRQQSTQGQNVQP
jgi:hypothetical protein